jgi:hypothetical protein
MNVEALLELSVCKSVVFAGWAYTSGRSERRATERRENMDFIAVKGSEVRWCRRGVVPGTTSYKLSVLLYGEHRAQQDPLLVTPRKQCL